MKFTISRTTLLEALTKVQNVVGSRATIQILSNALFRAEGGHLSVTTTDLDISIRCRVEAQVAVEGSTTLPIRLLSGIVRELPEPSIEIDVSEEDIATIQCGTSFFKILGLPHSDFPPIPSEDGTVSYRVEAQVLRDMLRKTAYAVSTDETRRVLTGILMSFKEGKLTLVATDGRRLAMIEREIEFPVEAEGDFVLPSKSAGELIHILGDEGDVRIFMQNGQAVFEAGDTTLSTKLIDNIYPNYRQVIPSGCDERVVVGREELMNALRRVSMMRSEKSVSARLTFADNRLLIVWQNIELGEARETVPIKYSGKEICVTFNPEYIIDPLRNLESDEVYIEMSNGHSPAIIKCDQPFLYVLMPLRVN
ncbi:MAG: DNA polymerase III subunit beta [Kiritimatiellia bacterium]|jgi:DNA polymerase-3 subunit beta